MSKHTHTSHDNHDVHTCGSCHLHSVHDENIEERVQNAITLCEAQGVRFTPLRQAVYRLILSAQKPVGAYDLINALQNSREYTQDSDKPLNIAPPTIYRSLEFLLSQGLVHQLNSMSAYVPCCHPRASHNAAFLICQNCKSVQEYSSLPIDDLMDFAKHDAKFLVNKSIIELNGLCQNCQNT